MLQSEQPHVSGIPQDSVDIFLDIFGDTNPIHREGTRESRAIGGPIYPGMFLASYGGVRLRNDCNLGSLDYTKDNLRFVKQLKIGVPFSPRLEITNNMDGKIDLEEHIEGDGKDVIISKPCFSHYERAPEFSRTDMKKMLEREILDKDLSKFLASLGIKSAPLDEVTKMFAASLLPTAMLSLSDGGAAFYASQLLRFHRSISPGDEVSVYLPKELRGKEKRGRTFYKIETVLTIEDKVAIDGAATVIQ